MVVIARNSRVKFYQVPVFSRSHGFNEQRNNEVLQAFNHDIITKLRTGEQVNRYLDRRERYLKSPWAGRLTVQPGFSDNRTVLVLTEDQKLEQVRELSNKLSALVMFAGELSRVRNLPVVANEDRIRIHSSEEMLAKAYSFFVNREDQIMRYLVSNYGFDEESARLLINKFVASFEKIFTARQLAAWQKQSSATWEHGTSLSFEFVLGLAMDVTKLAKAVTDRVATPGLEYMRPGFSNLEKDSELRLSGLLLIREVAKEEGNSKLLGIVDTMIADFAKDLRVTLRQSDFQRMDQVYIFVSGLLKASTEKSWAEISEAIAEALEIVSGSSEKSSNNDEFQAVGSRQPALPQAAVEDAPRTDKGIGLVQPEGLVDNNFQAAVEEAVKLANSGDSAQSQQAIDELILACKGDQQKLAWLRLALPPR